MKNTSLVLRLFVPVIAAVLVTSTPFVHALPKDSNGWTIFTPSGDTKMVYVSNSSGNDNNDGLTTNSPVKTISKGVSLLRTGFPDWLHLKRGDTWTDETFGSFKSGRSQSERMVVTYYGSGARPILRTTNSVMSLNTSVRNHLAFVGLDCYAYRKDPTNSAYAGPHTGASGFKMTGGGTNMLWEDCIIRYYRYNLDFDGYPDPQNKFGNIEVRRCMILDAYALSADSHSQGMYISDANGVLFEENLWDHNGWNASVAGAGATMFNHNIYMSAANLNTTTRGNIFAWAAAHGVQHRSGGLCESNLFVRNAVNVNFGHEDTPPANTGIARYNVIVEGKRIATNYTSSLAVWGIDVNYIQTTIHDNIVANRAESGSNKGISNNSFTTRTNNIVYQWNASEDMTDASWLDPERSVGGYHGTLGKTATLASFLTEARKRPIKTWWPEYSAYAVNQYIRAGFNWGSGDTTQPTVSMTAPANGAFLRGTAVTVSANASDNVGVVGVQFKLDGANLGAEELAAPYQVTWNTTTAANGSHSLTAVARDAAGNTKTATAISVTVDNAVPTVSVTAPSNGATVSGTSVSVTASASDNIGVVGVQFKLDGANLGSEDTSSPYSVTWNTTTASNGGHTLTAVARDAAGNTTTSSTINVTVSNGDTTPPTVSITAPASGATLSGFGITVSANASDNVGIVGVQFKLDGVNLGTEEMTAPYAILWNTLNTANGAHTLTAVARDAAGNTTTSAPVPITVSNNGNVAVAGGGWVNIGFDNQAATFTVEWDAMPTANNIDGVMGLANGNAGNYTNLAAIVRFYTNGVIEARNGNTYTAASSIPYSANVDHHFRLVVNVPAKTYSAYVTAVGGSEQTIGLNYAFRAEQLGVTQLNTLGCLTGGTVGANELYNVIAVDSALKVWLKLDETAGSIAYDSSKSTNNAALANGPVWTTGGLGGALDFDGVDDHAALPAGQANFTNGMTIAVWAFPVSATSSARFIDFGNGQTNNNIFLHRDQTTSNLRLRVYTGGTGGNAVVATNAIALNQWQHFAATIDGSGNVKLYKNGTQVATGTTSVPLNVTRNNNYIGRSNWSIDGYYDGAMDDLRIYNRVLTAAEILALP